MNGILRTAVGVEESDPRGPGVGVFLERSEGARDRARLQYDVAVEQCNHPSPHPSQGDVVAPGVADVFLECDQVHPGKPFADGTRRVVPLPGSDYEHLSR